ncbi:MAG: DNA-processing protein DprA [Oscillospiraceae bacterium]
MDNTMYWLWLVECFGVGNSRIWDVLSHYDDNPVEAYEALKDGKSSLLSPNEAKNARNTYIENMDEIVEYCQESNYNIICIDDRRYPERLKGIYNPPALLFCMGDPSFINDEVVVTVVGTRRPSEYSVKFAKRICAELVAAGTVLASGFALGIDSMAHQASLKANARTVAVLGCGLDVKYPAENADIKKIIAVHGAVITEFFPGTRPEPKNFPQRNRILSGISLGTLVIEASPRSGALITADLAINQGRDVFCVPPADLFDQRYAGVIRLIREGAIPTFSHLDIMFEYYENFSHKLISVNPFSDYSGEQNIITERKVSSGKKMKETSAVEKNNETEKNENNVCKENKTDYSQYNDEQKSIIMALERGGSLTPDEISALTGRDISVILSELTELEMSGDITKRPGQRYSI